MTFHDIPKNTAWLRMGRNGTLCGRLNQEPTAHLSPNGDSRLGKMLVSSKREANQTNF